MTEEFKDLIDVEGGLDNEQYELYCQARAAGKYISESAITAGFVPHYGSVLEKKDMIRDRIEELKLERRDLAGLDFNEQFRKWNELYNLAIKKGQLKVAKDCLDKIDILGGWGEGHPSTKAKNSGDNNSNSVLFSGDDPNSVEQLSATVKKVQDILNSKS